MGVAKAVFWEKRLTVNEYTGKKKGHQWPDLHPKKPEKTPHIKSKDSRMKGIIKVRSEYS